MVKTTSDSLREAKDHFENCDSGIAGCNICLGLVNVACFIDQIFAKPDEYQDEYESSYAAEAGKMSSKA